MSCSQALKSSLIWSTLSLSTLSLSTLYSGCVDTDETPPLMPEAGIEAGDQGAAPVAGAAMTGGVMTGGVMTGGAMTGGASPDLSGLPERLSVASYNVQNLFDLVDDPEREEYEYTPGGDWNQSAYNARVDNIARVVAEIDADVLVLQEVESELALNALAEAVNELGGPEYPHRAVSSTQDIRGIRLAVLSRFPFDRAIGRPINASHRCGNGLELDGGRPEARPIYEVSLWGVGDEALLTLLVNHWKSKAADPEPCAVSDHHKRAGGQIRGLLEAWLDERAERSVVVLGDFNAFETEASLRDALGAVTQRDALRFPPDLYNLWAELGVGEAGVTDNATNSSYYYDSQWRRLDHIMLTQPMIDGRGLWQLEAFEQVRPAFVMRDGRPYRWDLERQEGYSDHFPIKVSLRRASDN